MTYRMNRFTITIMGAGKGTEGFLQIAVGKRDKALAKAEEWHSKGFEVIVRDHLTNDIIYAEI